MAELLNRRDIGIDLALKAATAALEAARRKAYTAASMNARTPALPRLRTD